MRKGQTALEYLITYGWAILIILVVLAVLWYYGVFDPNRYAGETRSCPANFQILAATVTPSGGGAGTLAFTLANTVGHRVTVSNATISGDVAGTLTSGTGDLNTGETRNLITSISSGLGSSGTLANVDVNIGFVHSATGFNNLPGSTTCNMKLRVP
ncbi:hypothetical protein HY546_01010 [archaeon]|nr:hypothetical protein [archaeon]